MMKVFIKKMLVACEGFLCKILLKESKYGIWYKKKEE